jgi:ABC-type bacteriocin/lantibiotic exporter with double-glycine peptidase domain
LVRIPVSSLYVTISEDYTFISTEADGNMFYTEKRQLSQSLSTHSIPTGSLSAIELRPLPKSPNMQKEVILSLQNVRFGWKSPSLTETPGITLSFQSSSTGTVVILVGPVGCGKSTFLKGLAGETPVLEGELFIKYPDLAFCDEAPWLSNASIRSNIVGHDSSAFDLEWYRTVVSACALDLDLKKMPAGDETSVGSKGSRLSGGQRQRIVSCFILCLYCPLTPCPV